MTLLRSRAALARPVAVALAVGVATSLPGAAGPATAASSSARKDVVLRDIDFRPAVARVKPGGRVTWTWDDDGVRHNVRSVGRPRFKGAPARGEGTHRVRFRRKGTYRYTCTLHPGMDGRVVVR